MSPQQATFLLSALIFGFSSVCWAGSPTDEQAAMISASIRRRFDPAADLRSMYRFYHPAAYHQNDAQWLGRWSAISLRKHCQATAT
jgi:hypothetical protein